jgi:YbbR domain-containing protein
MDGRLRHLLSRLGIVILALLLAFVIWFTATLQADPFVTGEFTNLPITLVGQPADTVILQPTVDRTTVRVRAPQSVLQSLSPGDFTATMDVTGVQVGKSVPVAVQVVVDNQAVRIEAYSPAQLAVLLEAVETRALSVTIGVQGQVATGYQLVGSIVSPDSIAVKGPVSILDQVSAVSGTLSVAAAREPVVAKVEVTPRDADGNPVTGVEWTPEQVEVQAVVRKRLGYKPDVTVIPDLRGDPAPGYRQGSVLVEPSTVVLAGLPSVLDHLPAFVMTQPVSVTGATENMTIRATLTVPNGVMVANVQFVTVTLEILPIESSRIVTSVIGVQGLRSNLTATFSPDVVQVILVGPDAILAGLKPSDVRLIVDLFGYTVGVHRVKPVVLVPAGVTVVSVIPETLEVVITSEPVPTPTQAVPDT